MEETNGKPRRFGQFVDRQLEKRFKVSEEGRAEVQQLLYHPIVWLKGEALPFEKLAPWELLLFFANGFLGIATGSWDGRDQLYRFTYKVNANLITVSDVFANIWDGLNDPLFGSWMDRHPFKDNTYRWISRASSIAGTFLTFFYLLDLGLKPVPRIVLFTVGRMLMAGVAAAVVMVGCLGFGGMVDGLVVRRFLGVKRKVRK